MVDRNNPRVTRIYDNLDPAVIHAVRQIIELSRQAGKPVSVCGEMAGDPASALLLLGMGFDNLSMAASSIPRIKWVVRGVSRCRAEDLLAEALEMEHASEIRRLLTDALQQAGLGGLVCPGK